MPKELLKLNACVPVIFKKTIAIAKDSGMSVEGVDTLSRQNGDTTKLDINVAKGYDLREEIFKTSVERGWTLYEIHLDKTNLEDVFRQLTKSQEG